MTIRATDVQRLINLFGEPLLLLKKTFGAYNPATGITESTSTTINVIGYQASFDLSDIDGSSVIRGDRKIILSHRDTSGNLIDPDVDDEIDGLGDKVSIVSVSKIMSGSTPLTYICQVRE